ncbi:uncharacterized protein [Epargyreus clarus]|uniref:uncharacterized protein isoform X2 n=1 Tax=Epargyreus clarus TaxID=520877 RepID=UPI003C30801B
MGDIDLAEIRNKCLTSLYSCTDNVKKYLNNEKDNEFKLRNYVQQYCELELEQNASQKALEIAEVEDSGLDSFETRYQQLQQQELTQLSKSKNKFDKHPYMIGLEKHIKEADRVNRAAGHEEDSDLSFVGVQSAHIDPFSLRPIINPMRNKICKHVYEKNTIESIIKSKNKGCPYVGCTNKKQMESGDLIFDVELKHTLDSAAAQTSDDISQP